MEEMHLTRQEAARYLLLRHGLLGGYRYQGEEGVLQFVRRSGCIQFDPIDICGRNAELTLLSRVQGFDKAMLSRLLYEKRSLIDYFDKNLAIIPAEDWPFFAYTRQQHKSRSRSKEQVEKAAPGILQALKERGPLCARDLDDGSRVDWYWSSTTTARAALEWLYFCGELGIHHKEKGVKHYALMEQLLPEKLLRAPASYMEKEEFCLFLAERRIRAVGLLPMGPSDAWLGIPDFRVDMRKRCFDALLQEGKIVPVRVEGLKELLYAPADELSLLEEAKGTRAWKKRAELLAPLDVFLWDRKLIEALFGFHYTWEIYTPQEKRKYGYYVLPVLYGEKLVGRIEPVLNRKDGTLCVKGFWKEQGVRLGCGFERALEEGLEKLMAMNNAEKLVWETEKPLNLKTD